jgi:hypothetical protein
MARVAAAVSSCRNEPGSAHGGGEPGALGRIEVEDEVRHVLGPVGQHGRRVVLDGPLVR